MYGLAAKSSIVNLSYTVCFQVSLGNMMGLEFLE